MIFVILQLFRYILVSTAVGVLFLNVRIFQRMLPIQRFLFGFCLSPLYISLSTFLIALVWVGVPRFVLFLAPVVLSTAYLLWNRNFMLLRQVFDFQGIRVVCKPDNSPLKKVIRVPTAIFLLVILTLFGLTIHARVEHDDYGSDESHYLTQASIFYEDRNSREIDRYAGTQWEGTVFADDHGPLWPVYLADAGILSGAISQNSAETETAYFITLFFMLALLINTGWIVSGSIYGGIAALFLYSNYYYAVHFVINGSRDGFRIISLLAFFILLYQLILMLREKKDLTFWEAGLLLLFSYFCMNGHAGNVFIMLSATIVLLALELYLRIPFRQFLLSGISILAGTLLCFVKNILYYLETGTFMTSTLRAFSGTETERVRILTRQQQTWRDVPATFLRNTFTRPVSFWGSCCP